MVNCANVGFTGSCYPMTNACFDTPVIDADCNRCFTNCSEPTDYDYNAGMDVVDIQNNHANHQNEMPKEESWISKFFRKNLIDPLKHLFHPSQWTLNDVVVYSGGGVLPLS